MLCGKVFYKYSYLSIKNVNLFSLKSREEISCSVLSDLAINLRRAASKDHSHSLSFSYTGFRTSSLQSIEPFQRIVSPWEALGKNYFRLN